MDLFTLVARLSLDASDYEKGVQSSKQSFMGLANTVSAKAVAVGTMVAHGVERAAGKLIDFGKNAIQASADIEAEISLYQQVFGELEAAATGALESISQDTNILATRLRGIGTGAFMQFKGAGVDAGNAISMMDKYTRLAADAAAAYNISVEEADQKLRSFIRGNTEAGDAIGLFTSESQRNERAMATYKKKWTDLTEAQKQMLMLGVVEEIYKQTEVVGQAAREGHEWENVIGNLNNAFTQLSATVGSPFREALIPVIEKLTGFLSDETVTMRFGMIAAGIGNLAGKAFDGAIDFIDMMLKWSTGEEQMSDSAQAIMDILSALGNVASMVFTGAYEFVKLLFNGMEEKTSQNIEEFLEDFSAFVDSPGFQTAASVLVGILAAFLALNSPLLLVGLALGTIVTHWKDIKKWANKAYVAFKGFIETNVPEGFMSGVTSVLNGISDIVSGIYSTWTAFLSNPSSGDGYQTIKDIFSIIGNTTEAVYNGAKAVFDAVLSLMDGDTEPLEQAGEFFKDLKALTESKGFQTAVAVLSGILAIFLALNSPILLVGAALALIVTHWQDIKKWANKAYVAFKAFIETHVPEGFMSGVTSVLNGISDIVSTIYSTWTAFIDSLSSGKAEQGIANVQSAMNEGGIGGAVSTAVEQSWWWKGIQRLTNPKGASFATGLDYVPNDNFAANLHEGEAVLTKAEAADWRRGGSVQAIDYAAMGSAVGSAVREALSGIGLYTDDGTRIADMVTQRVSRNIAREAKNRRYAPVV